MPAIGHVVRDFVLSVDGTAYECAVTQLSSAIAQNTQTIRTACPDGTTTAGDSPVETLTLSYNVSHAPDSLYVYLRDHIGDTATVAYTSPDGLRRYTGTAVIGVPTADAAVGSVESGTCDLVVDGILAGATVTP